MVRKRGPQPVEPQSKIVGANLRLARRTLGVSQERLAEELGVSRQQIEHYEKGKNRIPAVRAALACKFLGVTFEYLWRGPALFDEVGQTNFQMASLILRQPPQQWRKLDNLMRDTITKSIQINKTRHEQMRAWDDFANAVELARREREQIPAAVSRTLITNSKPTLRRNRT